MGHEAGMSCVSRVPIFKGLSPDQQAQVEKLARPLRLSRGEVIHRPGDELSQMLVVHSGSVKISHLEASGQEQLVRIMEQGDFIGESAFLTGKESQHWSSALTPVQLCTFRHEDLQDLVLRYPDIATQMLRTLAERLEVVERRLADVTLAPVAVRLARYLIDMGPERGELKFPYPKKDVASLLGMSAETFSRQLRDLERAGVVQSAGRRVQVLDAAALREAAALT